jgi:Methyltransferase domain
MTETQNPTIERLRGRLVSARSPGSMAARARARRWQMFAACFPEVGDMRVLDLGGTTLTWMNAPARPREVVIVNLKPQPSDVDWISTLVGDACALPRRVTDQRFDLVYSNSVIEHVGGHVRREAFAAAVRNAADRYWVQTPYRYFAIEPHWLFPGFQFLPVAVRAELTRRWKLGNRRAPRRPLDAAVATVLDVELLSKTEMRHYFPDCTTVLPETFLGLVKSLIAVKAV